MTLIDRFFRLAVLVLLVSILGVLSLCAYKLDSVYQSIPSLPNDFDRQMDRIDRNVDDLVSAAGKRSAKDKDADGRAEFFGLPPR